MKEEHEAVGQIMTFHCVIWQLSHRRTNHGADLKAIPYVLKVCGSVFLWQLCTHTDALLQIQLQRTCSLSGDLALLPRITLLVSHCCVPSTRNAFPTCCAASQGFLFHIPVPVLLPQNWEWYFYPPLILLSLVNWQPDMTLGLPAATLLLLAIAISIFLYSWQQFNFSLAHPNRVRCFIVELVWGLLYCFCLVCCYICKPLVK